jgi:hypothetical protein
LPAIAGALTSETLLADKVSENVTIPLWKLAIAPFVKVIVVLWESPSGGWASCQCSGTMPLPKGNRG